MEHSESLERATQRRERGPTWEDDQFREARDKDLRQRTSDVRSAVMAAVSCLLLAALLTSGKIVEIAERQEFGDTRDRQLALAEGLDRVANFLSLNRPYDWIREIRGAGDDAAERIDSIDAVAAEAGIDVDPPVDGSDDDAPNAVDPEPAVTSSTSSTTTTTAPPLRAITDGEPLRVFVGGDSQAEYLAQAITTESELTLDVVSDHQISTSLARPDFFNWPAPSTSRPVRTRCRVSTRCGCTPATRAGRPDNSKRRSWRRRGSWSTPRFPTSTPTTPSSSGGKCSAVSRARSADSATTPAIHATTEPRPSGRPTRTPSVARGRRTRGPRPTTPRRA